MPYAESACTKIYWEEHGSGDPLLLIMGLGASLEAWDRIAPTLATRYRTILFDNRGVGRSDAPPGPYSLEMIADDAAAVLGASAVQPPHAARAARGPDDADARHPRRDRPARAARQRPRRRARDSRRPARHASARGTHFSHRSE